VLGLGDVDREDGGAAVLPPECVDRGLQVVRERLGAAWATRLPIAPGG
jgi:hypothetical protein